MNGAMPPSDGSSYRCKSMVSVDSSTIPITAYDDAAGNVGSGYLYFTPEQYCFGN